MSAIRHPCLIMGQCPSNFEGRNTIEQLEKIMKRFREFYPEHKDKAVMGILAGVDWNRGVEEEARDAGFPTAAIRDEIFESTTPEGFEARCW